MVKAAMDRLCAYCGAPGKRRELTREHFVPQCLWEGARPNRTLTVWVHKKCNHGYAIDDEFFRTALIAMNGTERHVEAQRVLHGPVMRVMKTRPGLFMEHLRKLEVASIESAAGLDLGQALTFTLDVPRFFRILRKIVLGLYFSKMRKPLPKTHSVNLAWDNPHTQPAMQPIFPHMSPILNFGDDVFIYRWIRDPEDDRVTFWCLGFYKAVSFYAATLADEGTRGGALHFLNVSPMSVWRRA